MPLHYVDPNKKRGWTSPEKRNPNVKTIVLKATLGAVTAEPCSECDLFIT